MLNMYILPNGVCASGQKRKAYLYSCADGGHQCRADYSFFEGVEESGIWRGSVLKQYEVPKRKRCDDAAIPDKLVVKQGWRSLLRSVGITLLMIVFPCVMLVVEIVLHMMGREKISGVLIVVMSGILFAGLIYGGLAWKHDLKIYRDVRLELTANECIMREANGASYTFHLDDVDDVNVVIEEYRYKGKTGIGKFLYIAFKDGTKQKFEYNSDFKNIRKIQSFVAYHKQNRL